MPLAWALLLSLGLHFMAAATVSTLGSVPDLDFEFAMPDQVEFGMTEAMEAVMVNAPAVDSPPPAAETTPDVAAGEGPGDGPSVMDAGVPEPTPQADAGVGTDAGPEPDQGLDIDADTDANGTLDGGVPEALSDAGLLADAGSLDSGQGLDAGPVDADTDAGASAAPSLPVARATIHGPSRIPAGAQLALRLDMGRLRRSAVADDVRNLIAAVPDWQELLGGSGIDPLTDLERVLIATPNRYRSRILVAGRHVHDEAFTRGAVARMAAARGRQAPWTQAEGVPVAPWANEGETERILALLGPRHFTISRPQDLPVVLAMSLARASRDAEEEGVEAVNGPDALLSMGPDEGLSLELEGLHAFIATGNGDVLPTRGRVAIRELDPRTVALDGMAFFPSAELATQSMAYWTAQRDATAQNFGARLLLGARMQVLESLEFTQRGDRVEIHGRATADDVRFALRFVQRQFEAWAQQAEQRRAAAAGGSPTTSGMQDPDTTHASPEGGMAAPAPMGSGGATTGPDPAAPRQRRRGPFRRNRER